MVVLDNDDDDDDDDDEQEEEGLMILIIPSSLPFSLSSPLLEGSLSSCCGSTDAFGVAGCFLLRHF